MIFSVTQFYSTTQWYATRSKNTMRPSTPENIPRPSLVPPVKQFPICTFMSGRLAEEKLPCFKAIQFPSLIQKYKWGDSDKSLR